MSIDRCAVGVRLDIRFDPGRLERDLARIENRWWQLHNEPGRLFSGGWSEVALISHQGRFDALYGSMGSDRGPFLKTDVLSSCDYLNEVIDFFKCPKKMCRLLSVEAGSEIFPHADLGAYVRDTVRIHIPVRTHPDVEFVVKNRRLLMQAGEVWYINGLQLHYLKNPSPVDRVHLVMDCEVNEFMADLFQKSVGRLSFGLHRFKIRHGCHGMGTLIWRGSRFGKRLLRAATSRL